MKRRSTRLSVVAVSLALSTVTAVCGVAIAQISATPTTAVGRGAAPAWSPSGTKLAWWTGSNLTVRDMTTGQMTNFPDQAVGEARPPTWLPDEAGLLYVRFGTVEASEATQRSAQTLRHRNLFSADLATGESRALTEFEEGVTAQSVAVSPDGHYAVIEGPKLGGPYASQSMRRHRNADGSFTDTPISVPYTGLWLVNLVTGERELLMRDERAMEVTPRFLPDGKRILFQRLTRYLDPGLSDARPETDLAIYNRNTGRFGLLTQVGRAYYPRLVPDGRTVAYARAIYPPDLWMMDMETGNRWQVDTGKRIPVEEVEFTWTPDSRFVLCLCNGEVHVISRTGRGPLQLTRGLAASEDYGQGLSVHPDGKRIARGTGDGDIFVAEAVRPARPGSTAGPPPARARAGGRWGRQSAPRPARGPAAAATDRPGCR